MNSSIGQQPQAAPAPQPPPQIDPALKVALEKLVEEQIVTPSDPDYIATISNAVKMTEYWKGNQYLVLQKGKDGQLDWVPVGGSMRLQADVKNKDQRLYDYHMNVFRGDGSKFIAVIGQRSPNVKAVPDRDSDEGLQRRASLANRLASTLRVAWKANRKQKTMAYHQWTTGTFFTYVFWRADGEKYGFTEEPNYEWEDQPISPDQGRCLDCGLSADLSTFPPTGCPLCDSMAIQPQPAPKAPVQVQKGVTRYPNGMPELRICNAREVTTPSNLDDVENAPWLRFQYEEDQGTLADVYPQLKDKVGKGWTGSSATASAEYGAIAREQASRPAGSSIPQGQTKWTYSQIWLTPSQYNYVKNETARETLAAQYPSGLKMCVVAGELVDIEESKLADHWSQGKPGISEGIQADPIGKDMLPVCDLFNDFLNYNAAAAERITPITLADPRVLDFTKLKSRRRLPGDIIPALANPGGDFNKHFFRLPNAEIKGELTQFGGQLIEQAREVTGILRPIFGGDSGSQTATEAESKRVQALMQLSTPYDETRYCWESTYLKGVKIFAKHVAGGVQMPGISLLPEETIEMKELADGGFHFEAEEGMPMTWAQKRALTWSIVDKGPPVWDLFGLGTVQNKQQLLDAIGFEGWNIAHKDDVQKIRWTLKQLLQSSPIPGPMGMQPSVPVDQFEDDHQFVVDYMQQWSQTDEALGERQRNPQGYMNAIAWALGHKALAAPPAPPPGEEGKGAAPPSGPPKQDSPQSGSALLGPPPNAGLAEPSPEPGLSQPTIQ